MKNGRVMCRGMRGRLIHRSGRKRRQFKDDACRQRAPLISYERPADRSRNRRGVRFEQLRPEQGARRPGTDRSDGDWAEPYNDNDDVSAMINVSRSYRPADRAAGEVTGWLHPAQAGPGAQKQEDHHDPGSQGCQPLEMTGPDHVFAAFCNEALFCRRNHALHQRICEVLAS